MKRVLRKFLNKIRYFQKIKFYGSGNQLIYPPSADLKRLNIKVFGNNNKIIIADEVYLNNSKIFIGFPNCRVDNCIVKIGYKSSFNGLLLQIGEDDSTVEIGEHCMCSFDIEINCTDHHSIFDKFGNLANRGKFVSIGDRVWLCKDVKILKNTNIPSGSIVAQGSVVTKCFEKESCVIAGNPAKIVKEEIRWDRIRPNNYLKQAL